MTRAWRGYALGACAVASAVVLALEILAARVLAPMLGSGTAVWAALLAAALGSLAAGNLLGGMLAARRSPLAIVAWALCLGAAALAAAAWLYRPVTQACARGSLTTGSLLAAAILEGPPMLLLGTIAPALIAAGGEERRGPWAGWVLSTGSAGGIAGALAAGLWLIPAIGLGRTFVVLSFLLGLAAVPACVRPARPAGLIVLAVAGLAGVARWPGAVSAGVVESPYGQIEVREELGEKRLLVDGLPQTSLPAGSVTPGDALRHGYLLELALFGRPLREALVIGLGGGLVCRILDADHIHWHAVELDPEIVKAAREEFALPLPPESVTVGDGRQFLAHTATTYDLIVVDVCTADRLPMHLFTREALALMRSRLRPGGILAMQFVSDDAEFAGSLRATARSVFPNPVILRTRDPAPAPRWMLASATPLPPVAPGAPFEALPENIGGRILMDDFFAAERAWARTALAWRRSYASSR
jgi:SAM-dependent methyltransferase